MNSNKKKLNKITFLPTIIYQLQLFIYYLLFYYLPTTMYLIVQIKKKPF